MAQMICFRVVKEPYGWAVRIGEGMMTPFTSRSLAFDHANGMAEALRGQGEIAEVVVEDRVVAEPAAPASRRWTPPRAVHHS
ncbi:hypothetical protein [Phenylobacterium sp.]|uniref:hypothetical protein n=1 Tax=Phenylobacterium sp. TaxID=1871053 RepID=UPI00391C6178